MLSSMPHVPETLQGAQVLRPQAASDATRATTSSMSADGTVYTAQAGFGRASRSGEPRTLRAVRHAVRARRQCSYGVGVADCVSTTRG